MISITKNIVQEEDSAFLLDCLEAVGKLRKVEDRLYKLTNLVNQDIHLSEALYGTSAAIIQRLLDDYAPEVTDSFIAAARKGEISLSYSDRDDDNEPIQ